MGTIAACNVVPDRLQRGQSTRRVSPSPQRDRAAFCRPRTAYETVPELAPASAGLGREGPRPNPYPYLRRWGHVVKAISAF